MEKRGWGEEGSREEGEGNGCLVDRPPDPRYDGARDRARAGPPRNRPGDAAREVGYGGVVAGADPGVEGPGFEGAAVGAPKRVALPARVAHQRREPLEAAALDPAPGLLMRCSVRAGRRHLLEMICLEQHLLDLCVRRGRGGRSDLHKAAAPGSWATGEARQTHIRLRDGENDGAR
jgi:hypothetical protein